MKAKKKRLGGIEYTESSGNVFADLGLPNPEEAMAKAKIAMKIHDTIKKETYTGESCKNPKNQPTLRFSHSFTALTT